MKEVDRRQFLASGAALGVAGIALASGAVPVFTDTKPPAAMMRSNALRSVTRSHTTGKGAALHGSITIVSPSAKLRM